MEKFGVCFLLEMSRRTFRNFVKNYMKDRMAIQVWVAICLLIYEKFSKLSCTAQVTSTKGSWCSEYIQNNDWLYSTAIAMLFK